MTHWIHPSRNSSSAFNREWKAWGWTPKHTPPQVFGEALRWNVVEG